MSKIAKPQVKPRSVVPSSDDVDGLLRAYFQSEMPASWSAPLLPMAAAPQRVFSLARSRWALAASVLALLLGHALLSRTFPDVTPLDNEPGRATLIGRQPGSSPRAPALPRSEGQNLDR